MLTAADVDGYNLLSSVPETSAATVTKTVSLLPIVQASRLLLVEKLTWTHSSVKMACLEGVRAVAAPAKMLSPVANMQKTQSARRCMMIRLNQVWGTGSERGLTMGRKKKYEVLELVSFGQSKEHKMVGTVGIMGVAEKLWVKGDQRGMRERGGCWSPRRRWEEDGWSVSESIAVCW